jgi:D-beta-D-heptose 7-phosphate kinase/D-beta-D-heptose 1-phosphate adenosyltransferase
MKVIVIGENCVDRFIYGEVKRFSPEAPIPVFTPTKTLENPGMAGNTECNVKALCPGVEIHCLTQPEFIIKTRYVEDKSNHMFLRVDEGEENITPISLNFQDKDFLSEFDITIVSDYNKGFLSNDDLKFIGRNSNLSILDSKRKLTKEIIESFYFVKLNESEAKQNKKLSTCKNIIITLGAKGAKYQDQIFPSSYPQETIDVSGAGDTFTAAFITNYYQYKNAQFAISYANNIASEVVKKRGVVTPF